MGRHMCVCVYVSLYMYVSVYMYTHIYIHTQICLYRHVCVCVTVCVCVLVDKAVGNIPVRRQKKLKGIRIGVNGCFWRTEQALGSWRLLIPGN